MCMCDKCMKICGLIFLVLGIVFVLVDLDIWKFWNIQWYSALFLVVGVSSFASSMYPDCQAVRKGKK